MSIKNSPFKVREKRLELGISQAELARILDVSHRTIWRWEQGGKISRKHANLFKELTEADVNRALSGPVPVKLYNPEKPNFTLKIEICADGQLLQKIDALILALKKLGA